MSPMSGQVSLKTVLLSRLFVSIKMLAKETAVLCLHRGTAGS